MYLERGMASNKIQRSCPLLPHECGFAEPLVSPAFFIRGHPRSHRRTGIEDRVVAEPEGEGKRRARRYEAMECDIVAHGPMLEGEHHHQDRQSDDRQAPP